jgi:hypothetical protein
MQEFTWRHCRVIHHHIFHAQHKLTNQKKKKKTRTPRQLTGIRAKGYLNRRLCSWVTPETEFWDNTRYFKNEKKHNVSETQSVSVHRWEGWHLTCWVRYEKLTSHYKMLRWNLGLILLQRKRYTVSQYLQLTYTNILPKKKNPRTSAWIFAY